MTSQAHSARPGLGAALMIGSALAWAGGLISSKAVLDSTGASPVALLTVQLGASVSALAIFVVVRRLPIRAARRDGWPGLLEPGIAYQLSLAGLASTSASNATVLASLEPVAIPLLGFALFRQRPRPVQFAAVAVATIAAIVVSWNGGESGSRLSGDLLVVGSVIAAAMYVVISHRYVERHHPAVLALSQQLWAFVLTVGVVAVMTAATELVWPNSPMEVAAAAGSGLCNYAIPFVLYLVALRHVPLATAGCYLCLIPVFGLIGAVALLGDRIVSVQIVGSLVIVATLLSLGLSERSSYHRLASPDRGDKESDP